MSTDLTMLSFDSRYPAFKNNRLYTGVEVISGTTASGTNLRQFTVTLASAPDLVDIMFSSSLTSGWQKLKTISVPTSGVGNPSSWVLSSQINGSTIVIDARYVQTFSGSESLTSTSFYYRIVDYSVFD